MKKSTFKALFVSLLMLSIVSSAYIYYTETTLAEVEKVENIDYSQSTEQIVSDVKLVTLVVDKCIKVIANSFRSSHV